MKRIIKWLLVCLVLGTAWDAPAAPEEDIIVCMKFYRGEREKVNRPYNSITACYLKETGPEPVFSDSAIAQEKKTLKRVFNLTDVRLKSVAFLALGTDAGARQAEVNLPDGHDVKGRLTLTDIEKGLFRIQVFDDSRRGAALLDTGAVMPRGQKAVLGFEDSAGHIYFLSFQWQMEVERRNRLVYRVEPEYPAGALKQKIQGKVVLKAETDPQGSVVKVTVVEDHPVFVHPARAALMQWKYEPYVIDGKKVPAVFTVAFDFQLRRDSEEIEPGLFKPRLLHRVTPAYPQTALKARLRGTVKVKVEIGADGHVIDARVIMGHPILNGPALRAVRQWKYEPYELPADGKTVKVDETIRFDLE